MKTIRLAVAISLSVLVPTTPLWAAEIKPIESEKCRYLLSGVIAMGDAEKIAAILDKTGDGVDARNSICLNSPGGNYLAGKQLYDAFMTDGFATYVRKGDECHSACAIAFLGGSVWGDFRHPSRTVEPGGIVGFHAPYAILELGKKYSAEYVSSLTRTAFGIVTTLIKEQEALKISRGFLTNFILFDSERTKQIETVGDAAHAGISIDVKPVKVSFSTESITHACETLFDVYGSEFINSNSAVAPDFRIENTEFSKNSSNRIKVGDVEWVRVSTQHDWETPNQTASCAFNPEIDASGYYEAVLWSNDVGEDSKLDSALQTLKTAVPWWYFMPKSTKITDLAN